MMNERPPGLVDLGNIGGLAIKQILTATTQTIVIYGGGECLVTVLQRLGLDVTIVGTTVYVGRDAAFHEVLLALVNLLGAIQYSRPNFGQLVLWEDRAEVAA